MQFNDKINLSIYVKNKNRTIWLAINNYKLSQKINFLKI